MLTTENRKDWERDGVLILPGFYSPEATDALLNALARAWAERVHVTVDDLQTGQRLKLGHVTPENRVNHRFKVNDLYLEFDQVRDVSLDRRMVPILTELLNSSPVLCTTLSLEHSTQQENHIDSLYMTPRTTGHLVATWVALEDVSADAGPLRYYPGSHKIPLYTFRDGSHHASNEEHGLAIEHIERQLVAHGLQAKHYCPRRGDVLIWHANLVHGGSPIVNRALTRKSMVSHFFSESDSRTPDADLVPHHGGYWLYRPHLSIPAAAPPPPPIHQAPDQAPAGPPAAPLRHRAVDALHSRLKAILPARAVEAAKGVVSRVIS